MSQRLFAVSTDDVSPCGPWSPDTISIPGDDIGALRSLFADHYPRRRIAEILGAPLPAVMAPIAIIVESEIRDVSEMSVADAQGLLKTVMGAAILRLPALADAIKNDEGYRASYMWDSGLKRLVIHVVCPNTYHMASEMYSAIRGIHLPSAPLNTSYKGFVLQDKIQKFVHCVPLYMGPGFTVLQSGGDGYVITTVQPQIGIKAPTEVRLTVAPSGPPGGLSGRAFGGQPHWMAPIDVTTEYFIRMIRGRTRDYDHICCDVAYAECGSMSKETLERVIGMKPCPGMKKKSIRFLHWVAKRVCPEEYNQWILEQCAIIAHYYAHKIVTDEILQRLFVLKLEGDFVSVIDGKDPNGTPSLYHFHNIWVLDKGMTKLEAAIPNILTNFIGEDLMCYMEKIKQSDIYTNMLTEIRQLYYRTPTRSHSVRAAARMVREDIKFDEDPNLFGCHNVVIELGEREAVARPGRPEDLVSKTNNLYYQHYDESECGEVRTMFRKLFLDQELRDWFFRLLCSMLCGTNPERSFYVMFGSAKNGKSGILNWLEILFGDYFGRFSGKAFNERSDPSSTSPELAAMHGMRVMAGSELKAGVQMEADIIKALTGDDGVQACGKYQDPKVLRMMAKIIIASNHFPIFLHADKALRDRTVLIPLESRLSNYGVPATEAEQYAHAHFPAIENFRPVLQRLAPMMFSMMVDGWADYKLVGLSVKPKKVVDLTEGYWHEVGVQTRFMADCIEFVDEILPSASVPSSASSPEVSILPVPKSDPEGRPQLTYKAGYERFVGWAASRGLDISKYPRFTFKSLMDCEMASLSKHKIEFTTEGWVGCKLKKASA